MAMPISGRSGEDDQPHRADTEKDRLAARFDRDDDRGRHRARQIVGRVDLDRVPAPDPHHEVGEDDRKSQRDQRLAQVLALHAAKDQELHGDADQGATNKRNDVAEQPGAGPLSGLVAHIAAEQVERAVRQVDVAHQPEDQGEAGGDQKIKSAESDAVEQRVDKQPLFTEHLLEPAGHGARTSHRAKMIATAMTSAATGLRPIHAPARHRRAPERGLLPDRQRPWSPPALRFRRKLPEQRAPRHACQSDFCTWAATPSKRSRGRPGQNFSISWLAPSRAAMFAALATSAYSFTTRATVRYSVGAMPTCAEKKWVKWLCDEKPSSKPMSVTEVLRAHQPIERALDPHGVGIKRRGHPGIFAKQLEEMRTRKAGIARDSVEFDALGKPSSRIRSDLRTRKSIGDCGGSGRRAARRWPTTRQNRHQTADSNSDHQPIAGVGHQRVGKLAQIERSVVPTRMALAPKRRLPRPS